MKGQLRTFLNRLPLFFVSFGTAFCFGLVATMQANNIASGMAFIGGDTTFTYPQVFSTNAFGLGVGYVVAAFFDHKKTSDIFRWFSWSEIILSPLSSLSVLMIFLFFMVFPSTYTIWTLLLCGIVAFLVGLEDQLVGLILANKRTDNPSEASLSLSYFSANMGSFGAGFGFGYLLLQGLSIFQLSLLMGLIDAVVVSANIWYFRKDIGGLRSKGGILAVLFTTYLALLMNNSFVEHTLLQKLYTDPVITSVATEHGREIVTCKGTSCRLYTDHTLTISTNDSHEMYEPLVHPAMSLLHKRVRTRKLKVALLGGGDGFTAKELLRYPEIGNVHLVEEDTVLVQEIGKKLPLTSFTSNALLDPRITIIAQDPFMWMRAQEGFYDLIVIDPNALSHLLFTQEFFILAKSHLGRGGILVIPAQSPTFTPKVFWTIALTAEHVFSAVDTYRWDISSVGDKGWVIATDTPASFGVLSPSASWLSPSLWKSMHTFTQEELSYKKALHHRGAIFTLTSPIAIY